MQGSRNLCADFLSRFPVDEGKEKYSKAENIILARIQQEMSDHCELSQKDIRNHTSQDTQLKRIREFLEHGWPLMIKKEVTSFLNKRDQLSFESGIIMHLQMNVILMKLREAVLKQ